MGTTRRQFIALVGAVATVTGLPQSVVAAELLQSGGDAAAAAARLTTLAETLVAGTANNLGYRAIATGPGEPHLLREELASAQSGREARRQSLLCFMHLTDQHIIDVQSPTRVEFTDRFVNDACPPPFESAQRAQEAASARIADAMIKRIRAIANSPVTGSPIAAAVCTGDNIDNQQANEADVYLALMDGGTVTPNSGDPTIYEGVQVSGDLEYWHPDPAVQDRYKTIHGFPDAPGFLEQALASFEATGLGIPWYSAYGNHDGLLSGNAPANPVFEGITTGPLKVNSPPPGNPCLLAGSEVPIMPPGATAVPTTPDPERRFIDRAEYAQKHLDSPGLPRGHGFTQSNVDNGIVYYAADVGPFRFIVLDTVNPGGFADGSIGDAQLQWLDAELAQADANQRMAIMFSHHGLRSLNNPVLTPDPADPSGGDLPRRLADDVLAVCQAHPSLIAWVNGHTHSNVIITRGEGTSSSFWDIGTAAHIDWPPQARIIDIVDNADGTLSLFTTMIDYDGSDPTVALARELMANDPQGGFTKGGQGEALDRNTELVIGNPFSQTGPAPTPTPTATPTPTPTPTPQTGTGTTTGSTTSRPGMPATGGGQSLLTIGGALLLAGASGIRALRRPHSS